MKIESNINTVKSLGLYTWDKSGVLSPSISSDADEDSEEKKIELFIVSGYEDLTKRNEPMVNGIMAQN